jgi:8-hydroxy-5-deazaflavin:NADPH oxidoreductase
MRIGIVGVGEKGAALAELLAKAGHQLAVADPRDDLAAKALAERLGPSVLVTTLEEAARFGDGVILAVPFDSELLPPASAVAGKVVIDATNAVTESGEPMDLGARASSLIVAEWLPDAVLVKAFNTLDGRTMLAEARPSVPRDQRFAVFVAGDNGRANARVSILIEEIGFTPIATGSLEQGGRLQEPRSKIFGRQMLPAQARRELSLMR